MFFLHWQTFLAATFDILYVTALLTVAEPVLWGASCCTDKQSVHTASGCRFRKESVTLEKFGTEHSAAHFLPHECHRK